MTRLISYFYAPKDDAAHRFYWLKSYDADWLRCFADFNAAAARNGLQIIAAIAPGLDFNFASLDPPRAGDFACLVDKARQLSADGASHVSLLMDDIAADFTGRAGSLSNILSSSVKKLSILLRLIDFEYVTNPSFSLWE